MSRFLINFLIISTINLIIIILGMIFMMLDYGVLGIVGTILMCYIASYFVLLILPNSGMKH